MTSNFSFLHENYNELFVIGKLSEQLYTLDPSSSLAKARLFSEKLAQLIWKLEDLGEFEKNQAELINALFYNEIVSELIKDIFHTIRKSGNRAVHLGNSNQQEALFILKKSFALAKWFYETYENSSLATLEFQKPTATDTVSINELNQEVEKLSKQIFDYQEKIRNLNETAEKRTLRKERSFAKAGYIQLDEYETRKILIDKQLREAGWECDTDELNFKLNKTLPQKGKNRAIAEWPCKGKWADYALFIGTELYGIVEAKKYSTDISTNLHQSKIYAERIELNDNFKLLGQWNNAKVPFLFSTNGRNYLEQIKTKSGIWFLDIRNEHNRSDALQGWFSPQGLLDLYKRDIQQANHRLENSDYTYLQSKTGLALRYYQIEAIQAVEQKIIQQPDAKRALLVMATGTGKTRTTIGLVYRLIKSDRFKRILFLTDRRLLATQALASFKDNKIEEANTFTSIYGMQDLKTAIPDIDTRLHFATVQSMVKRLFYSNDNPLAIDTYDCIIVDEAHRGYNLDKEIDEDDLSFKDENDYVGQYKKVIHYFNAFVVGLTATPAFHTTEIFGKPIHNYSYREAVVDGFLVDHEPPYLIKTDLSENGMVWEKGEKPRAYNPETNTIEDLATLEDELKIEIEQFNKLVVTESFNRVVVQELVKNIDPEEEEKTLIFAARETHADLLVRLLYEEYEKMGYQLPQDSILKLTGNVYGVEDLTRNFKNERFPNIVVTVDLLTTGIDIPQITNLVFVRRVRSRILFEQMLGRATRLCPSINKQFFRIFDAVRVYEALQDYTQMKSVSNPAISFQELVKEMEFIESPQRARRQLEQIIAKIQRKKKQLEENQLEQFIYYTKGDSPEEFIQHLTEIADDQVAQVIVNYASLWKFLDEKIYTPKHQLVSEHRDNLIGIERGYGKATKPEDYIESFKEYIQKNRNAILAIQTICTKPAELDRKSLKELKLRLEEEGFNTLTLNTAWKNAKNQDIAADIISYIRTLALDKTLISHENRIKKAFDKVRNMQNWNKIQHKWIDRFEKQLLHEDIFDKQYMNEIFKDEGGLTRIEKIFNNELDQVIQLLNDNLFTA